MRKRKKKPELTFWKRDTPTQADRIQILIRKKRKIVSVENPIIAFFWLSCVNYLALQFSSVYYNNFHHFVLKPLLSKTCFIFYYFLQVDFTFMVLLCTYVHISFLWNAIECSPVLMKLIAFYSKNNSEAIKRAGN